MATIETGHSQVYRIRLVNPADVKRADVTTEVCDGLPSDVEDGSLSGDRYCPWDATVIAVDPVR